MPTVRRASREQVLAFRLSGHDLIERRPPGDLLEAAAACGSRNTPPGSLGLGLNARVADLTPAAVEQALVEERSLVEVLGPRISPYVVPARDLAVFTFGALPADEASLKAVLNNLSKGLDEAGISAAEAVELAAEAADDELASGPMGRGALSAALTGRLPEALSIWCRACGSRHIGESLFRLIGTRGVFVIARQGKRVEYARTDQWLYGALGKKAKGSGKVTWATGEVSQADRDAARTELLRRYLRCYGPSTPGDFGGWVGIGLAEAKRAWEQRADRLVEVDLEGRRTWLHADDMERLQQPPKPSGVRLLPPYDAYLDQRDRPTLLPDKALHKKVWQTLGNPGVVLLNGEVAGLWRPKKQGRRLSLSVEALATLPKTVRGEIEAEAALLGAFRDATSVEVAFAE